jgi:hypothetical protein
MVFSVLDENYADYEWKAVVRFTLAVSGEC